MTITDIIRNEIADCLGHNPSSNEQSIMIDYIHDGISDKRSDNKKIYLVDIEERIRLCRDENFAKCEECGGFYLPEDMNDAGHKCKCCAPDYDVDYYIDLKREGV